MAFSARRRRSPTARASRTGLLVVVVVVIVSLFGVAAGSFVSPSERLVVRGEDWYDGASDDDCRAPNATISAGRRTLEPAELYGLVSSERGRAARLVEIVGLSYAFDARLGGHFESLGELFFPAERYGQADAVERAVESGALQPARFRLEALNMSHNGLTDDFLDGYSYGGLVRSPTPAAVSLSSLLVDYFGGVRVLALSYNALRHVDRRHFALFVRDASVGSQIETLLLDHNGILTIRHDAFYDLTNLKHLDVSSNRLKILHPFTLTMCSGSLYHLDLSHNRLQAFYKTTPNQIALAANSSSLLLASANETTTTTTTNATSFYADQYQYDLDESTLTALGQLRLRGNSDIRCDCGLIWLHKLREQVQMDDFTCKYENVSESQSISDEEEEAKEEKRNYTSTFQQVPFKSIDERTLESKCRMPNLVVNVEKLQETSTFEFFRWVSRRWFNWAVFPDYMPPIIPFPYLTTWHIWPELAPPGSNESTTSTIATTGNDSNSSNETAGGVRTQSSNKHIFFTWRMSDVIFDCEDELAEEEETSSAADEAGEPRQSSLLKSAIIWKTQYGYLSYLDHDLAEAFRKEINATRCSNQTTSTTSTTTPTSPLSPDEISSWQTSFQIFYKMNKLTKIYQNMSILVSSRFGTQSVSQISVNERNQLKITNIRKVVAGPIVCIALNARGVRTYEFDINMRSGIGENFIYSLFISLISCIIPSIAGIVICCYCEYEADKNYPMTPPCYPTPTAATPPNFDINEWMSNAASYLPNLNISETLEQVSKKLRKGMEKATVTVKSLGLTSSAYIYSMYEQSTQRFQDIRSYVPNINVPTLSLPTMRYPPMGDLANRMRMGMGNMFIHFKEFCGTSDLTHTPSIVDIEADTNASKAVGRGYIIDQINLKRQQNTHYRFLNFIREESKRAASMNPSTSNGSNGSNGGSNGGGKDSNDSSSSSTPTTSGLSSAGLAAAAAKLDADDAAAAAATVSGATVTAPNAESKLPMRGKDSSGVNVYVRTSQTPPDDDFDDDDVDSYYEDDPALDKKPEEKEDQV